jgi:hypothetical protein
MRPVAAPNNRLGSEGVEPLQVTAEGHLEWETFYGTHYVPDDLSEQKVVKLAAKLNRPPELVVFEKASEDGNCSECGTELLSGDFLLVEKGRPLCLNCADLDQLVFLPAGNVAMSRRARKHSSLAAVVVRFSRTRKRYERQGPLVTEYALASAEVECAADAPARAAASVRAGSAREDKDQDFVAGLAATIRERYPRCPADEAHHIAAHTGRRNSGRVGRSAAGRALDGSAADLAVIAHIRHTHTHYDELLMQGTDRLEARKLVREKIDHLLAKWRVS